MNKLMVVNRAITSSQRINPVIIPRTVIFEGEQWIDTGLPNSGDYIFEDVFKVHMVKTPKGDGSWILCGRDNSIRTVGVFIGSTGFFNGYGAASVYYTSNNIKINEWIEMYFSRNTLTTTVDGITQSYNVAGKKLVPEEYAVNILLGKCQVGWNGGDDVRTMYGERKTTKIYDTNTNELLRHYVAGEYNGIAGMFDKVNNKMYESDGPMPFKLGDYY